MSVLAPPTTPVTIIATTHLAPTDAAVDLAIGWAVMAEHVSVSEYIVSLLSRSEINKHAVTPFACSYIRWQYSACLWNFFVRITCRVTYFEVLPWFSHIRRSSFAPYQALLKLLCTGPPLWLTCNDSSIVLYNYFIKQYRTRYKMELSNNWFQLSIITVMHLWPEAVEKLFLDP